MNLTIWERGTHVGEMSADSVGVEQSGNSTTRRARVRAMINER